MTALPLELGRPLSPLAMDLDGDGFLDLVAANPQGEHLTTANAIGDETCAELALPPR